MGQEQCLSDQAEAQGTHRGSAYPQGHPHRSTQTQTTGHTLIIFIIQLIITRKMDVLPYIFSGDNPEKF